MDMMEKRKKGREERSGNKGCTHEHVATMGKGPRNYVDHDSDLIIKRRTGWM